MMTKHIYFMKSMMLGFKDAKKNNQEVLYFLGICKEV